MSAESIARWNAIPMTRLEQEGPSQFAGTKRSRQDVSDEDHQMDGDDSDDDVSLVSRSPSPVPQDQMDIDKYDDYVRGPVREVITVDTKIKSTNKGFAMLAKLGWVEGTPLGLSPDARVDPIPFQVKNDATGLGKTNQDFRMIETTVSQRRELDSERQRNETEEQRRAREGNVARRVALQSEIQEVLRPFYCDVCDKQFQNVAQYDEHTNSYAHHHKIRFRDMQNAQRAKQNTPEEQDRRKEKERKREEKELRKIAAAAGVRVGKGMSGGAPALAPVPVSVPTDAATPSGSGFKKGGWANTGPSSTADEPPPAARGGWATVGPPAPAPAPGGVNAPPSSSGGWSAAAPDSVPRPDSARERSQPHEQHHHLHQPAPAFRAGGWASIDSTTRTPPPASISPAPPTAADGHRLPQQPQYQHTPAPPLQQQQLDAAPLSDGPLSVSTPPALAAPPTILPDPSSGPPPNQETLPPKTSKSKKAKETAARENSRSGWQAFQKGGRRK
ncbi:hypothetical protein BC834DRAFT_922277 [Gloeopeniophorella convolvens]|nr:hypothetical protein BC834DRAFT_922277 [Gloeopeniophorella convolvens]